MKYLKKIFKLVDNYVLARLQNRPSTALFWYLPEPANIKNIGDLERYQNASAPFYLMDYREKLSYSLENEEGIIVLPYDKPIGQQVNPEAAFQYALGLHDQGCLTQFYKYADYFVKAQSPEGLWAYDFDWFASKKPWSSALAQARGSSVMLRAWLQSKEEKYREAAKLALGQFLLPTAEGGFLHRFAPENCLYFEEYPQTPTGVINGFMASLMSIWELHFWLKEPWLSDLWTLGIASLEKMLPHYSTGWWSLYDLDEQTPVANVNSPRYHFLEMHYLQVLSILSSSKIVADEYQNRCGQYNNVLFKTKALGLKVVRKVLYR